MKITSLMCGWNSSMWLPQALRGIYNFSDYIIFTESCWVKEQSTRDNTELIVKNFIEKEDPLNKVFYHYGGYVSNQPEGRNSGLYLVPEDTDWIFIVDCDEFYFQKDLDFLKRLMLDPLFSHFSVINVLAKCFYFDFTYYKTETFVRGYRWFPGQRFWAISSMIGGNGKTFETQSASIEMFHGSYVGKDWTYIKGCMGEDLPAERYRVWYDNIFSKFNGANLEELYSLNKDGIHVNGGGRLERYFGPYPEHLSETKAFLEGWR